MCDAVLVEQHLGARAPIKVRIGTVGRVVTGPICPIFGGSGVWPVAPVTNLSDHCADTGIP